MRRDLPPGYDFRYDKVPDVSEAHSLKLMWNLLSGALLSVALFQC